MRKADAMASIFGRGMAARQAASSSQSTGGIIIYFYGDFGAVDGERTLTDTEYGSRYTVEHWCYKAAESLKLSPLTAPLLALATVNVELYLPPNEYITCSADSSQEFVLRVRFIPPENVIGRLASSSLHSSVFDYLFLQIRSDFLNDRIDYQEKSIKQEHLLGLGVIDMVRHSKEHSSDLRRLQPQDFIPVSLKKVKFNFLWDRKRLQMNFRPHLDKEWERYRTDNAASIKLTYVKSLLGYTDNNYGMETFVVSSSQERIVVKPYDKMFPGISVYGDEKKVSNTKKKQY
jgi:FERM F2 acyl-CoA binding protein-like domain/FERM F1 ubiquitin-like domain